MSGAESRLAAVVLRSLGDADAGFDKRAWGQGPWLYEPDHVEWLHRGVPCMLQRHQHGHWCGYAACEASHPWFGLDMGDVPADAHGGITWARAHPGATERKTPRPLWWLGFDCNHAFDLAPGMEAMTAALVGRESPQDGCDVYRDYQYVKHEARKLAEQIIAAREH